MKRLFVILATVLLTSIGIYAYNLELKQSKVGVFTEVTVGDYDDCSGTVYATVIIDEPQTYDVSVLVKATLNGTHIGSGYVTIPAGSYESQETPISVELCKGEGKGYATLEICR